MSPTLAGGFFTTGQPGKPTLFSEGETQVQRRLKKLLKIKASSGMTQGLNAQGQVWLEL